MNTHLTALILAAGLSRRMGAENKLLLPFRGQPVLLRVVEAVQAAPVREIVVVTGHERAQVQDVLAGHPVRLVYNADYVSGMGTSIRRGVAAAAPDAAGFLICLGDLPLLSSETLVLLRHRFAATPPGTILIPTFEGRRGHPVLFDALYREALAQLDGDAGARAILERHAGCVLEVPVSTPGILRDVDTPDAYRRLAEGCFTERPATERPGAGNADFR